jgi:c-di-GMP-binding flagellar brake protein YcgR
MELEKIVAISDQGVRVSIELGTQLFLQLEGIEVRLKSSLVGMEPGDYLIVQMPHMAGINTRLGSGNQLIVRYIRSGTVYGFQCNVIGYIMKPFRLLFLSYPKIISSHNLRKQHRVECFIPVVIWSKENEYAGAIMDISSGGCLLTCQAHAEKNLPLIEVGDRIKLSFQLPGQTGTLMTTGQARNIIQESDKTSLGLEFDPSDSETLKQIEDYVENVARFKDLI